MDVASLLRKACDHARLSQTALAARAGTSPAAVSQIMRGKVSPSVRTLDRLLAAAGLQIRAELEPLLADLDVRVDAALTAPGPLDAAALSRVGAALDEDQLSWGLDAETALRAHGFGFSSEVPQVALALDDAARAWFFRARVRGTGGDPVSWFDSDLAGAQEYLGRMALGPFGMIGIRLQERSPETVRIEVAPGLVVPVLTVDEVERGRPDLAEVLARLRERRERVGRT